MRFFLQRKFSKFKINSQTLAISGQECNSRNSAKISGDHLKGPLRINPILCLFLSFFLSSSWTFSFSRLPKRPSKKLNISFKKKKSHSSQKKQVCLFTEEEEERKKTFGTIFSGRTTRKRNEFTEKRDTTNLVLHILYLEKRSLFFFLAFFLAFLRISFGGCFVFVKLLVCLFFVSLFFDGGTSLISFFFLRKKREKKNIFKEFLFFFFRL